MSNKQETPVSWLVDKLFSDNEIFGVPEKLLNHALEMESKKQQKYDEMLEMLEKRFECLDSLELNIYSQEFIEYCKLKQLIKEAKEL
jgi:hypothetical protein